MGDIIDLSGRKMNATPKVPEIIPEEMLIFQWQYKALPHFETALMDAISLADNTNLNRIAQMYPIHVKGFVLYNTKEGWWDSVQQKLVQMQQ